MATAALFGSTGLVGGEILIDLLASGAYSSVHTISRRKPKVDSSKLQATLERDVTKWSAQLSGIKPVPSVVFSAVGTTRAAANGVQAQWKIDHDLNVALAKAAKAAGVPTFVFISSAGTRSTLSSRVPYSMMKVGVEDTIKELDFEHGIILRPGLIMGRREVEHTGGPWMNAGVRLMGRISQSLQDSLGQEKDEIGRAAVQAAKLAAEGKAPDKYWVLEWRDIVRLGRIKAEENGASSNGASENGSSETGARESSTAVEDVKVKTED